MAVLQRGGGAASSLTAPLLGAPTCDGTGVPTLGRAAEYELLLAAGACDASVGRLFEGHVNALQLVARFGTDAQRARATDVARAGGLFGVWNTEPADGVRVVREDARGFELAGRKTFGSGAGRLARAIVTASTPGVPQRMMLVPMDEVVTGIDRDSWHPLGMHDSESYSVSFDGVRLTRDACIGEAGDYQRDPWFSGGASRFLAVQAGAMERLLDELGVFLNERARADDALQLARAGACAAAVDGARLWVEACVAAWERFDAAAASDADVASARDALLALVDTARVAVEAAALATLEAVERSVGARGLLEPLPFARMIRDLRMYLRQPNPDAALLRAARHAVARGAARSSNRSRA